MKISYSVRAFVVYFVILGSLLWFLLDNAIERLNVGMRQSAESVLVDTANLFATLIEQELSADATFKDSVSPLQRLFETTASRQLVAQIYQVTKTSIDSAVYVTDAKGLVIYDSNGTETGLDFSQWRDVRLTLEGQYGARTSFIDTSRTEPEDAKAMYVAAPIRSGSLIMGVVSVSKPIASLEAHLVTETRQLQRYAFALLFFGLVTAYLLSLWFTYALNKISRFANKMAEGKQIETPMFRDSRLDDLAQSISHMRHQLDGKEYVENYIHSLTHELKTPITSIQGAVELLDENMPLEDRRRFLNNISNSNRRMSRLVERMLSLAKLEGLSELVETAEFDLLGPLLRLSEERAPSIAERNLSFEYSIGGKSISAAEYASELNLIPENQTLGFACVGDRTLITQAVANLLDNAINFAADGSIITIQMDVETASIRPSVKGSGERLPQDFSVRVINQGPAIPLYALPKLYDRFFSLPREIGGAESKSTGLGLSFVKEIMKLHNGQVRLDNTDDGVAASLKWTL